MVPALTTQSEVGTYGILPSLIYKSSDVLRDRLLDSGTWVSGMQRDRSGFLPVLAELHDYKGDGGIGSMRLKIPVQELKSRNSAIKNSKSLSQPRKIIKWARESL